MKKTKKVGSIIATLAIIGGGVGAMNSGKISKVIDCVGKEVQIETEISGESVYYCGSGENYGSLKSEMKSRLTNNSMMVVSPDGGEEAMSDYVAAVLLARNDAQFYSEVKDIMLSKYDKENKRFKGVDFDSDFREQMALYVEIAKIKCGKRCSPAVNKGINEAIYNILTK